MVKAAVVRLTWLVLVGAAASSAVAQEVQRSGVFPTADDGRALNLGFETGTLADWSVAGEAFEGQPVRGDTVHARRRDMKSGHAGDFWVGSYEVAGDAPRGTLTSAPFAITHPWATFLVGGGSSEDTRVELVTADDAQTVLVRASGTDKEDMSPVAVDLRPHQGKRVFVRLVDDASGGWGHINFDDFRFQAAEPKVPPRQAELTIDKPKHQGLTPEEAVKAITVPPGFNVTLFAGEPDVNQPVGFCLDDRGRLWVAEAWDYPQRRPDGEGRDRIVIFEDADNDGRFDKRTVFMEKLNLVSGIELGFGGVWIGAAPHLLFIPDRDRDDKPDGPPEVLLDGWGWQDTHETLNAFTWGPDGWLYGCHGVFTHSKVGKPGTPDEQRVRINAGVWRYHPTKHVFEVFAEGTSNPWGIDFNDHGQPFITACVIPHLYHVIQGARYQRQAGQHFNPHTYRDIPTIADHVHYLGASPHGGNNRSSGAGGGHAHCGAMVYLGDSWPAEYRNALFMGNIHGNRFNSDRLVPNGSGYVGVHAPDLLLMNDGWSRLINLKYGPDGGVYFIDWYDKQACHHPNTEIWDRTNGRIYKLTCGQRAPAETIDLAKLSDEKLVELQLHKNDWYVRKARRILQERGRKTETRLALERILEENDDPTRKLRALWAIHATGGLTPSIAQKAISSADPYVRGWTIQLTNEEPAADAGRGPPGATSVTPEPRLALLAMSDPSPVVRLYVASALQRVPVERRWDVLTGLVSHSGDAADHNLPLMIWYAADPAVAADPVKGLALAKAAQIPLVRELIARRVAALATEVAAGGSPDAVNTKPLALLGKLLLDLDAPAAQLDVLRGMADALQGRPSVPMPEGWAAVHDKLSASTDEQVRLRVLSLSTTFGDARALAMMRSVMMSDNEPIARRRQALDALIGAKDPSLAPLLQELLAGDALRDAAVRGLAAYDDPKTPALILAVYPTLDAAGKVDALNTLASRVPYARELRAAVAAGTIPKGDVSAATLRQLHALDTDEIRSWLAESFGTVRTTPQEKLAEIAEWKRRLTPASVRRGDLHRGRAIFAATCMQCHTLFDAGGKVGPDLTGSNRADVDYVLQNSIDPGAVIGKDYQVTIVRTKAKRVLSGILKKEDDASLTLMTENETIVVPKGDIDLRKTSEVSMMPEGLLAGLKEQEVRDLVAYLASPKQVPMLATPRTAASLFNGKDLDGWDGDPDLWRVENGEIVGSAPSGLKENAFLRTSRMVVGDFRLTLKVKLVGNKGNSGIQFRSEPLAGGDVKGYQADAGPGWWGKLYEEHGRALLWDKPGDEHIAAGEWNTYEVLAVGSTIKTAINGKPCVDLDDPAGARRGIIAFQIHSGGPTEIRFKDIQLEADPKPQLSTVK